MNRDIHTIVALLVIAVILGGCGSTSSTTRKTTTGATAEESGQVSPLGLGHPDPDRLLASALAAAEAGNLDLWLSYFGFSDPAGNYFVTTTNPRGRVPDDMKGKERMREWAASYRTILDQDFVDIDYGRPRNIRNSPPVVSVPVIYDYKFNDVSKSKRAVILERVNQYRPARARVDWEGFVTWMRSRPSAGLMHFVYVDQAWRFDAMRK